MSAYPRPTAVVLAFEPEDKRQSVIADAIRSNFSELMKLTPADRKARIDQLLKPERTDVLAR